MKALKHLVVAALCIGTVGCANVAKMPLQTNVTTVDTTQKSILVARVRIKNENRPSHQPVLSSIMVTSQEKAMSFANPTVLAESPDIGREYFVSMDVAPGKTKLNNMFFIRSIPMLLMASAVVNMDYEIDVPSNKVVYLGNIVATIVPRTDDSQPRAGAVIPLIDQSVAGFSSGTFKVDITDKYTTDTTDMIAKFPALAGKEIVKNVLSNRTQQAKATVN